MNGQALGIEHLRSIVAQLRGPEGCPWDREQTHATLRAGLLEEAYEVVAAIDAGDDRNLREELGDLLLQIVFHSQIASEQGRFDLNEVAEGIAEKLVRRHPHVFGDTRCNDTAAVLRQWDELKRAEKGFTPESALDGVPRGLSALMRAQKVQTKAARVGFDWDEIAAVLEKVREELAEIEAARTNPVALEEEIGDLLFSAVNLGRKCKIDCEVALQRATDKFIARFQHLESLAVRRNLKLDQLSLSELDALWDEVKRDPARAS